jgi:hypothetical protein
LNVLRRPVLAITGVALACASFLAHAQVTSTLYVASPGTTYQSGCFPPCLCPIMVAAPVSGTLRLTPAPTSGEPQTFAVTDIAMRVVIGGVEQSITGSGSYAVGAGKQRLAVDLSVAGQLPQHYDSGDVDATAWPAELKAAVSMHNMVCHDTVFAFDLVPAPAEAIPALASRTMLAALALAIGMSMLVRISRR